MNGLIRSITHSWLPTVADRVHDASWNLVGVYDSTRRRWRPADDFPQADFERVLRRLSPGFDLTRSRIFNWVMAGLWLGLAIWLAPSLWLPLTIVLGVLCLLYVEAALTCRRVFPPLPADRIAYALVAEGRCGSCAYDLRGCEPGLDGVTICPECASVWRMSDDRPYNQSQQAEKGDTTHV